MILINEKSNRKVSFLDLQNHILECKLLISRHQYLPYLSFRPENTKSPVICSQTLRLKRLFFLKKDVNQELSFGNTSLLTEGTQNRLCNVK